VTDYNFILRRIEALREDFEIQEIAFDRWGAAKLRADIENALAGSGTALVQFGQGFASMSPPSKELERLILERAIRHGNHPVLDWMAENAVVRIDPAGNIKPDKEKSPEKIDGIVALVMALDRAVRWREHQSVYETRAPRVIRF
jgi:phage terminase large subunit-like protein